MFAKLNAGWLLVFSFAVWAITLPLFQDGMFFDGVLYAAVARNLALGSGSFWNPYVSQSCFLNFHEQPPLVFWLQSLFFRLDSQTIYPERIYSSCFLILSIWAIQKFWKEFSSQNSFWPVLLFLLIPTIQWGFVNNVLENTMLFFDLLAVYFFYKSMKCESGFKYLLLGILFTFLASFSKGIQGLFPLAIPVIYAVAFKIKLFDRKVLLYTLLAFGGIILIYAIMLISYDARESYRIYFERRFQNFPKTRNANIDNRLELLLHLCVELIIPVVLCCIIWLIIKISKPASAKPLSEHQQTEQFFLFVALSASFPLMTTFEQREFYLNTSMPYYALALAVFSKNWITALQNKLSQNPKFVFRFKSLLVISIMIGIIVTAAFAGKPKRDEAKLHDIKLIGTFIGNGGKVCTTNQWNDWSSRYYFVRYHQISLYGFSDGCQYFIVPQKDNFSISSQYHKIDIATKYYDVYQK